MVSKEAIINTGQKALESTIHKTKYSATVAVDVSARIFESGKILGGNTVIASHNLINGTISSVATQINRYTPDVYDVGGYGQNDLTADAGMFLAGNSAMIAQNAVRMARGVASPAVHGLNKLYYNQKRLERIKEESNLFQSFEMNGIKPAEMNYTELITGKSQREIFMYRHRMAQNRYIPNAMNNASLDARKEAIVNKFKSNKYDRVISRQANVENYSMYLKRKRFSLVHSSKAMIKNQSRKLTNAIIRGNDADSTTNKTMWYANKAVRAVPGGIAQAYRHRAQFQRMINNITHPVRALKNVARAVLNSVSVVMTAIASIPVIATILAALIPIVFLFLCIFIVISSVLGFVASNSYVFSEIKLCDTGNSIKDLANESAITSKSSEQYKMLFENKYGQIQHDEWGLAYIEDGGYKWYCNAMATYYTSTVGDRFRLTLDSGEQIYIIICDIKADKHTHKGNNDSSNACLSGDGSMVEFYGDVNKTTLPKLRANGFSGINNNLDENHKWKGAITKVERATKQGSGDLNGSPDFSNADAWMAPNNPYAPGLYGQCTWFAWGRFYEIYGYDPGFRRNGYQCVGDLLATHPDKFKFSKEPMAGAVGSSDAAHNHVWIVTAVNGDVVTVQEGNLDGKTNPDYAVAITDWHTTTYTKAQLKAYYGDVSYAVPK